MGSDTIWMGPRAGCCQGWCKHRTFQQYGTQQKQTAMCSGIGAGLGFGRFMMFFMTADIIQFGRTTSNVITGMSVTDQV